jgi:DNA-directed RNA polymerase specialized sigma subunit
MNPAPAYTRNDELFREFYALQCRVAGHLAQHLPALRRWLEALPQRSGDAHAPVGASKSWRTARLSMGRRRELAQLIAAVERAPGDGAEAIAQWLRASVPVRTYLEIADVVRTGPGGMRPAADESRRELIRRREELFLANYGLAKASAFYGTPQEYDDRVSAASCGLLDAIDRYVPGPQAARFGYFASYWIRYHLARHAQKSGSLVSFPIHQHRLGRKIDRYLESRRAGGLPPPTGAKVCAELSLGPDAYYWHQRRPKMVSLHSTGDGDADSAAIEFLVCEPEAASNSVLDDSEFVERFERSLRVWIPPATRVMLAYNCGIGRLPEAAEDYLASLQQAALQHLRPGPGRRARR